jgi:hypothetical protein
MAKGCPELWVRLVRPIPYPAEQVRAVTLLADGGRLWLAVTAGVPVHQHELDPDRAAGVDLGIIHPYAVVSPKAGLLVSGRAIRAESYLHLRDQQARQARSPAAPPSPASRVHAAGGGFGSGTAGPRPATAAASTKPTTEPPSKSSPRCRPADRHPRGRRPQGHRRARRRSSPEPPVTAGRRTHLLQALRDKAEQAGMPGPAARRARHLLHLPSLPAAGPQAVGMPVPLPPLHLPRAPGSGRRPQHRRQTQRRRSERGSASARRAPSGRHRAGTA